jgi:hypothetical protein
MALRIRRGTDAQRSGVTFEMGEIVWTTDSQQLFVGNGVTQGGTAVIGAQILGYGLVYDSLNKRIEVAGLTSDDVTEGSNRLYHTTERAVDAVGAALVAGNLTNVGITFTYSQTQDDAGRINATVALDGVGITEVAADTSPSLGGDLDLNSHDITGTGVIDITGDITATSIIASDVTISSSSIVVSSGQLAVGTALDPLDPTFTPGDKIRIKGIASSQGLGGAFISLQQQKGTYSLPSSVSLGDTLGGFECRPYVGSKLVDAGFVTFRQDDTVPFVPNSDFTASVFTVVPTTASGFVDFLDGSLLTFNSKSVLATKVFKSNGLTSTQRDALTPQFGMMIYNSTTKKFQGYTEDAGSSTPGWVDLS